MNTIQLLSSLADFGFFAAGTGIASIAYYEIARDIRRRRVENKVVFKPNQSLTTSSNEKVAVIKNILDATYSTESSVERAVMFSVFNTIERDTCECRVLLKKAIFDAQTVFGDGSFSQATALMHLISSPVNDNKKHHELVSEKVKEVEDEARQMLKK